MANGIWRMQFGMKPAESLLALTGAKAKSESLGKLEDLRYPLDREIECEQVLDRFVMRFPVHIEERLYGLGLNYQDMTLNAKVRHLRCDHYGGRDNGRTHAPVPFFVSDRGYGIFVDVAENISFYMAGTVRADAANPPAEMNRGRDDNWQCDQPAEFVEASFVGIGADVYVIAGRSMTEVVSRFNLLCGGGCLPPKWGLGFWHRVHIKSGAENVLEELRQFGEHDLPVSVIGLEPGWQTNSYPCTFEWDRERYPDPGRFVRQLLDQDVRLNLWENMYISKKAGLYEEMLPLAGSHKVWGGIVPDYTMQEARRRLIDQHAREHVELGVSGYKIDECDGNDEWLWPDHAKFPSGRSATVVRNVYGACVQRLLGDMYRAQNRRTYGLVRASNAGAVSLPFCIYNDCYDFKHFLTGVATAGFSGVLWVPEVRDAQTGEEWVRRFQLSAMSPMLMLNAWANGAKPWKFPEVFDKVRDVILLRERLLPYFYNTFFRYYNEGVPPFRALAMDYSSEKPDSQRSMINHTGNPYEVMKYADVVDQYLVGECMMVAPMLPGHTERQVVLPGGKWYDFYTGECVGCAEIVTVACPLERIPVFVKEGGMVPMRGECGQTVVHCYGEGGDSFLYDDDGLSFDNEKGKYSLKQLSFTRKDGSLAGCVKILQDGFATACPEIVFV